MIEPDEVFDREYLSGRETQGERQAPGEAPRRLAVPELQVDVEQYGNGKPRRVVIRARIADVKD